jgi:MFS superfamily sulfate permease-like transporter
MKSLMPEWTQGYSRKYIGKDMVAGATLAAVAIPEVLGYTSISQTPLATGLYTIIFPTIVFALFCSSRLLVVGADSATAALMSAGLLTLGSVNLTPYSDKWVAYTSIVAITCAALLLLARILKLGFLGDFLSASVLIGFLTGVGIQVLSGQIPDMLGIPKGTGNWLEQQWAWISSLGDIQWETAAFAAATVLIIVGFRKFAPRVPGALIAVVVLTGISAATDASSQGVAVVGDVPAGFPPIGLPKGFSLSEAFSVLGIALSCLVLIIAQSAATGRSFAMKHGDKVDINRDIVGLSGANLAAGLTGTFVVNGSPTKTEILDEQHGRSQVANLTMAAIALLFTMFFTSLLADMPKAVLAGIVFLIGVGLIDLVGMRAIKKVRVSEFYIAVATTVVVFAVGVEQGIIVAIVVSILDIIRRQYRPASFVVSETHDDEPVYTKAAPGTQSEPGLVLFRYDAELFYANANRFVEDVQGVVAGAPDPVRWVVLDASAITDVDYSAGIAFKGLAEYLEANGVTLGFASVDPLLHDTMVDHGLGGIVPDSMRFDSIEEAVAGFRASANA